MKSLVIYFSHTGENDMENGLENRKIRKLKIKYNLYFF